MMSCPRFFRLPWFVPSSCGTTHVIIPGSHPVRCLPATSRNPIPFSTLPPLLACIPLCRGVGPCCGGTAAGGTRDGAAGEDGVRDGGVRVHCVVVSEAVAGARLHRPGHGPQPREIQASTRAVWRERASEAGRGRSPQARSL